jgi:hypothetical protein
MVEMINIQANGKTNILRFSTQSGHGRLGMPLAISIGAKRVSGIHMKMKVGMWMVNAWDEKV